MTAIAAAADAVRAERPLGLLAGSLVVCLVACTHTSAPRPPPTVFTQSAAYGALKASVRAVLERDLDGDGHTDVVLAQSVGPGFVARVLWQRPGVKPDGWSIGCVGPVVQGESLERFQWVPVEAGELLVIVAEEEDPDEINQGIALVDVRGGCEERFSDRLWLPKSDEPVLSPGPVFGGVVLGPGSTFRLVDEPDYLTLGGSDGAVRVIASVRERFLHGTPQQISVRERQRQFLVRQDVAAQWTSAQGAVLTLDELTDGSLRTAFVARPGEAGELLMQSERPLLLLELAHGCFGMPPQPLELHLQPDEPAYVTGKPPPVDASVRASGKSRGDGPGGSWLRDLLVMRHPRAAFSLALGPAEVERCVREIKAYGWVGLTLPGRE